MANTLTSLAAAAPAGFAAIRQVRKELTGIIAASSTAFSMDMLDIDESLPVPVLGAAGAAADVTAAVDAPEGSSTTVTTVPVKITKSRKSSFLATGRDTVLINRIGFDAWFQGRVQSAAKVLLGEIEAAAALAAATGAGWGIGTAGTDPFASSHAQLSKAFRIFEENGVKPDEQLETDMACIVSPLYGESLRGLGYLYKVNEGGDNGTLLRQGTLGRLQNFNLRTSGKIVTHTKGTVSGVTTTGAAAGAVTLPVSGGTFTAGDLVTIAGITDRQYVASGAASGGNLTLNAALYKAAAATSGVTIQAADHIANILMHRRALAVVTALPAKPPMGDKAAEVIAYSDGETGLTFEVARYDQYMQTSYEVRINYGVAVIEPDLIGILAA